ncbi:hypothetical protein BKA82DRAFT_827743 [Pisolithus tinctorius]|uniref:Uncharacterized protein n=1 Tax=Pisolithus tinctorius Marx 270 TaxID=870435 RepID=A0A0C3NTF7_PISTI|nr:hypothetical protein BKA82DRAFT_827743 [Pisolithus tinctorius]KIN98745.1 hypothetical protein M404DRAFT_827743 [Pisolithus tinctorius Marx 270]
MDDRCNQSVTTPRTRASAQNVNGMCFVMCVTAASFVLAVLVVLKLVPESMDFWFWYQRLRLGIGEEDKGKKTGVEKLRKLVLLKSDHGESWFCR